MQIVFSAFIWLFHAHEKILKSKGTRITLIFRDISPVRGIAIFVGSRNFANGAFFMKLSSLRVSNYLRPEVLIEKKYCALPFILSHGPESKKGWTFLGSRY